jgi:hypothetical protein
MASYHGNVNGFCPDAILARQWCCGLFSDADRARTVRRSETPFAYSTRGPVQEVAAKRMNWLERYQCLNRSFEKICVFHVGVGFGFFSEYNNMVLALLYCLKHRIRFRLASADANFAVEKGYSDYFLSVFEEDHNWYNRYCNTRPYLGLKHGQHLYLAKLVKLMYGIDYFTQDIWHCFRSEGFQGEQFDFQQLGINGDLLQATSLVIEQIWKFQPSVDQEISAVIAQLALPTDYVGFHIRRGDKMVEAKRVRTVDYFRKAEQHTHVRAAFIATDDYKVVVEARESCPEWTIYTLCEERSHGHAQIVFNRQDKQLRYTKNIRLLADIEILRDAQNAYVTYSSNVGMFLAMRRGHAARPHIYSMDLPQWQIW